MALTVFTYHRITPEPHPDAVDRDLFRRQLDFIQQKYRMLDAEKLREFVAGTLPDPKGDFAALTFDDGWLDNWLCATPILRERGLQGILALSAGFLHDGNARESAPQEVLACRTATAQKNALSGNKVCYLNRNEIAEMHKSGSWSVQSHGTLHKKNNRKLSSLAVPAEGESEKSWEEFLRKDLENCRAEISKITGTPPDMMIWPWGHYSKKALQIANAAGFKIQFSTEKSPVIFGDKRAILPRVGVPVSWKKFTRNAKIFSSPILSKIHGLVAHKERLEF